MKLFAELFAQLDQTNQTNTKIELLANYFKKASKSDIIWVLALLMDKRPKRSIRLPLLKLWAAEIAQIPAWLFEESYQVVGDLAETISLVLPAPRNIKQKSVSEWMQYILQLSDKEEDVQKISVLTAWDSLEGVERFLFIKLIGGSFRVGVSHHLVIRSLSLATGIDAAKLSHKLMGNWNPENVDFDSLILADNQSDDYSKPYPFYLAYPLEDEIASLGDAHDWLAEWKWDGIRGQIIVRGGEIFVWSRGEELVTDKFLEFQSLKYLIPAGTVLDGEIVGWKNNKPLPFGDLQTRITRKNLTKKHLTEVPVVFISYDILEWQQKDIRHLPLQERRKILEEVYQNALELQNNSLPLKISQLIYFEDFKSLSDIRIQARNYEAEGLMLKRKNSDYQVGRKKGDWWKWKVNPFTVDAVLLYAQKGHGRRANLYTDYTFAVWKGEELVVFTKAYSGLTDLEIKEVDAFIQHNTLEKFGPVRTVKPTLVFEIAFEGIQKSSRHKSGIALRFPRILRWRKDKKAEEANKLEDLLKLIS
ncbi:MAG: ATP-dependent DNA ligase [Flammeovirgaceae bacterium]